MSGSEGIFVLFFGSKFGIFSEYSQREERIKNFPSGFARCVPLAKKTIFGCPISVVPGYSNVAFEM